MNRLSIIKKQFVEFDSAKSTWIAEVAVQMKTTPYPLSVSLLFTVPKNSTGPNKSTAMEWNAEQGPIR